MGYVRFGVSIHGYREEDHTPAEMVKDLRERVLEWVEMENIRSYFPDVTVEVEEHTGLCSTDRCGTEPQVGH